MSNAIDWIAKESGQQAERVRDAILEKIQTAAHYPERFPPDKFKINNTGIFRGFETHSYVVSFSFDDEEIIVLRVRHVRQKPLLY